MVICSEGTLAQLMDDIRKKSWEYVAPPDQWRMVWKQIVPDIRAGNMQRPDPNYTLIIEFEPVAYVDRWEQNGSRSKGESTDVYLEERSRTERDRAVRRPPEPITVRQDNREEEEGRPDDRPVFSVPNTRVGRTVRGLSTHGLRGTQPTDRRPKTG